MIEIPRYVDWIVWAVLTLFVMLWPGSTQAQTEESTELPAGVLTVGTVRMQPEYAADGDFVSTLNMYVSVNADAEVDNAAAIQQILQVPGVTDVMGSVETPTHFRPAGSAGEFQYVYVHGYSTRFEEMTIEPVRLLEGRFPLWGSNEMVVERRTADRFGLQIGDQVEFRILSPSRSTGELRTVEAWTITGIVNQARHPYGNPRDEAFFTLLDDAGYIAGMRGLTMFKVRFIDSEIAGLQKDTVVDVIAHETPYIVGFSIPTPPSESEFVAVGLEATLTDDIVVVEGRYPIPGQHEIMISNSLDQGTYEIGDVVPLSHLTDDSISMEYTIVGVFEVPAMFTEVDQRMLDMTFRYMEEFHFDLVAFSLTPENSGPELSFLNQMEAVVTWQPGAISDVEIHGNESLPSLKIDAIGYDVGNDNPSYDLTFSQGQPLTENDAATGVVISDVLARNAELTVGDSVTLESTWNNIELTVVGIAFYPGNRIWADWHVVAKLEMNPLSEDVVPNAYYGRLAMANPSGADIERVIHDLEDLLSENGASWFFFNVAKAVQEMRESERLNLMREGDIPAGIIGMYWEDLEVLIRP